MRVGVFSIRLALAVRPVLRAAYGRAWPVALARSLFRARRLVRRTRWGGRHDEEARHVRALAIVPAVCLELDARPGGPAAETVSGLIRAVLDVEGARLEREAGLARIRNARERWHAFFERGLVRGLRGFDESECLSLQEDRFHVRVFRCVFAELAQETGVPALAQALCAAHADSYARVFPAFAFHRNGSPAHTLAHGHSCCEYVWERRAALLPQEAEPRGTAAAADAAAQPATPDDPPPSAPSSLEKSRRPLA